MDVLDSAGMMLRWLVLIEHVAMIVRCWTVISIQTLKTVENLGGHVLIATRLDGQDSPCLSCLPSYFLPFPPPALSQTLVLLSLPLLFTFTSSWPLLHTIDRFHRRRKSSIRRCQSLEFWSAVVFLVGRNITEWNLHEFRVGVRDA